MSVLLLGLGTTVHSTRGQSRLSASVSPSTWIPRPPLGTSCELQDPKTSADWTYHRKYRNTNFKQDTKNVVNVVNPREPAFLTACLWDSKKIPVVAVLFGQASPPTFRRACGAILSDGEVIPWLDGQILRCSLSARRLKPPLETTAQIQYGFDDEKMDCLMIV